MASLLSYADLEIGLHRRDGEAYAVELRFTQPESDADVRLEREGPATVQFDLEGLRQLTADSNAYGKLLSASLFADADVHRAFAQARAAAGSGEVPLRMRLFVGPSAPELHSLRWETLRDPDDGSPLLTGEQLLFSRYLSSTDWRPVRLRPQAALKALIVIANPSDLDQYSLAPVDVASELERARTGLAGLRSLDTVAERSPDAIPETITELASPGKAGLENIMASLRDGIDILYVVAHGARVRGEPWLWLEDGEGKSQRVAGDELATRLRELRDRPRLVVLASCQSAGTGLEAGTGADGALAALGPRLAEVGASAVLAMQGNILIDTVTRFMPVFFRELQRDGQIDRAAAVARGAVRDCPDWWAPALFMRLKSGRIWYIPGFGDDRHELEKWPALMRSINSQHCTPILGPGLTESLLGSRREIARRWAETYHFPMAPDEQEDLPQVAQYLAVNQDAMFPRLELADYLRSELLARLGDAASDQKSATLDQLIGLIGQQHRAGDPALTPHEVIAGLPLPIFITTDPSNVLAEALRKAGKDPKVELCRWNDRIETLPSIYDAEPGYRPTPERPMIFHLFGRIGEPDSVVLTEDDYFDYLIGVTTNNDLVPGVVRRALADTALLFLGFRMDEWDFRVLFRSIMSQEGSGRRSRYAHVAAQIDPEEGRILEPERARRYLESYFQGADISIYWGSADDFLKELKGRMASNA
jgi:hypothetical protein